MEINFEKSDLFHFIKTYGGPKINISAYTMRFKQLKVTRNVLELSKLLIMIDQFPGNRTVLLNSKILMLLLLLLLLLFFSFLHSF